MSNIWFLIEHYINGNAEHRRGFKLKELCEYDILESLEQELQELKNRPRDLSEAADVMACLIHHCICCGWTEEQVTKAVSIKLIDRFKLGKNNNDINFSNL